MKFIAQSNSEEAEASLDAASHAGDKIAGRDGAVTSSSFLEPRRRLRGIIHEKGVADANPSLSSLPSNGSTRHRKRVYRAPIHNSSVCDGILRRFQQLQLHLQHVSKQSLLRQMIRWIRRNPRSVGFVLLCIPFILRPSRLWKWSYRYFGPTNMHGGTLGRMLERRSNRWIYEQMETEQRRLFDSLNIVLSRVEVVDPKFRVLDINFRAALKDLLVRRETRAQTLARLELNASSPKNGACDGKHACVIPNVVFTPDVVDWHLPRPHTLRYYHQLSFDESEMMQLVEDVMPNLLHVFRRSTQAQQLNLWAICAVYYFGGVFVGDQLQMDDTAMQDVLLWGDMSLLKQAREAETSSKPWGFAVLDQQNDAFRILAATPRHPAVLNHLENWGSVVIAHGGSDDQSWSEITLSGDGKITRYQMPNTLLFDDVMSPTRAQATRFYVKACSAGNQTLLSGANVVVEIAEANLVSAPVRTEKIRVESILQEENLEPGWICVRCMKMPTYGRLDRCRTVCPVRYHDIMCTREDEPAKDIVLIDMTIRGGSPSFRSASAIPKHIHQTWFETMSIDRYPQMGRVSKSWKQTGYKYSFYTDETARDYINQHFPSRFVDAFDVILPGAYKADFFRYMVLLREGGIYVDIDILLETNLDHFLTSSMTFFAPRDVVAEFAGEPFCLWNGLIGAMPGHPFLIREVERLVTWVLDRADFYDMERDLCRRSDESLELWKIHTATVLLMCGPCSLGMSVNEAMGLPSLQKIDTGWMSIADLSFGGRKDHGDALILVVDKHDLGSFRISDPERNIIVASTNLDGFDKNAREIGNPISPEKQRSSLRKKTERVHYSKTLKSVEVWGSSGVYADSMVNNEVVQFRTRFLD